MKAHRIKEIQEKSKIKGVSLAFIPSDISIPKIFTDDTFLKRLLPGFIVTNRGRCIRKCFSLLAKDPSNKVNRLGSARRLDVSERSLLHYPYVCRAMAEFIARKKEAIG